MDARYPNEWAVSRGSRFLNVLYGFPFDSSLFNTSDDGMPLIRIRDVISGTTSTTYGGTYQAQYVVHHGDVLIGMDGDFNMAAWKSSDALLNQRVCLVRDSQIALARYLLYALPFKLKTIHDEQDSTTVTHLSAYDLNKLTLNLPPIKEQRAIIMALDESTTRYDVAISTLTSQLDVLRRYRASLVHEAVTKGLDPSVPMKPSGVKWIGDINAAWLMSKVKYQADVTLGKMLDAGKIEMAAEEAPYLRAGNIVNGCISGDIKMMPFSLEEKPKFLLRQGDALVVEGGNVGETAIYESADSEMYFQKSLNRVRMFNGRNRFFAYWMSFLKSTGFLPQLCNRSTILHYTREKLLATPMVCPPDAEQDAIVSHLDEHCARIDSIIDLKQRQLDILKRRRQSLIYEYVTGKRRVR